MTDRFILTRKVKKYTQGCAFPKISVDQSTYRRLQETAAEHGGSISSIAVQAIAYALNRLEWVDEQ